MKGIEITHCAACPWNEHGQHIQVPIMESYLGYNFYTYFGTQLGPPMLYCKYRPWEILRDNVRGSGWHKYVEIVFIIWIAGLDQFEGEFEKQLIGFPKRCPLQDIKLR